MITHRLFAERDRDFIAACRGVMARNPGAITSLRQLADEALKCTAPRYYVDIDYAYRVAQRLRRPGGYGKLRVEGRAMWAEIMGKVECRRRLRPLSLMKAVTEVLLEEEASGFFMARSTALRHLQTYNRRHKAERFYFPY